MRLETDRLILRRFCRDDWTDLYAYLSDESVVQYEPYPVFTEEACRREAIRRSENDAFWAVCLKESGRLIGNLYFQRQSPEEFLTWEIGYVFNPRHQGKGYATEACRRMMEYAFVMLGAHRIIGRCNPENTASWRLMERLSMRREDHFKKAAYFRETPDGNPIWHDAFQYAILEEEWFGAAK